MTVLTVLQWVNLLRRLTFHNGSGGQNHVVNMITSLPVLHEHIYCVQSMPSGWYMRVERKPHPSFRILALTVDR